MIHTIIWLTVLGVALLIPNVMAIRFALLGTGDAPARVSVTASSAAAVSPALTRAKTKRVSPKFVRGGYMWKALSPIVLGFAFILAMGLDNAVGTVILVLALFNLIYGFMGWDAYIPGKKR